MPESSASKIGGTSFEYRRTIRNPRLLTVYVLCIFVGFIMFLVKGDLANAFEAGYGISRVAIIVVAFIICGGGLSGLLLEYLKGNLIRASSDYRASDALESLENEIQSLQLSYKNLLEKSTSSSSKEIDIDALSSSIRKEALSQLPRQLTIELENKFASKSADYSQIGLMRENLSKTSYRLREGIEQSIRRSNLNLIIGIMTTALAAGILAWIAFETKPDFENLTKLLGHYIPRLTTIVFVEVFAFFFLRLYKTGLQEIRYFQNELTNIELQVIAIEASLLQKHTKPMEGIIRQLIKTERNPLNQNGIKDGEGENNITVKDVSALAETLSKISGKN